jgi:hypothetical protein
MLKMKVDPEMCMKTKDRMTKCLSKKQTFSAIEPDLSDKNGVVEAI